MFPGVISATDTIRVTDQQLVGAINSAELARPYREQRLYFPSLLQQAFTAAAEFVAARPMLRCAYSVKTNPSKPVLTAARAAGMHAEVISPQEMDAAQRCGFAAAEIVYNGPFPATRCRQAPGLIFADSLEAYEANRKRFPDAKHGLRLRPPDIDSRFGIPQDRIADVIQTFRRHGVGEWHASFHVRPQDYGTSSWRTVVEAAIGVARSIERASGARARTFDVGGGKQPHELDAAIACGDFEWLQTQVVRALPHSEAIYFEPGQALVTSYEAVVAPVLEIRRRRGRIFEMIVDAGYPDLPQIGSFPHRLFLLRGGVATSVGPGEVRVLGRTCLEYDTIAAGVDMGACDASCAIVIADAGAYDSSMRFKFARGA